MALNLDRIGKTAENYMLDTITVQRKTGETMNSVTLAVTDTYSTVYTGKAWVASIGDPQHMTFGSKSVYRTQYEIGLPSTAPDLQSNDKVTVTVSNMDSIKSVDIYVHDSIVSTFNAFKRVKAFSDSAES